MSKTVMKHFKTIVTKILKLLPPVRRHLNYVDELKQQVVRHETFISNSRSPALYGMGDDFKTERLLAHPLAKWPTGIRLGSIGPMDKNNRIAVAERLIQAYHCALKGENKSPLKREGEDLWTGLIRNELPELMSAVDKNKPEELAEFLKNFGQEYVWFGGITTCIDGYNKNLNPKHVALTYWDKLVCLAEYLGVLRVESPEAGPWGDGLHETLSKVIDGIEKEIGIEISPPLGIIHTDGVQTDKGLFHYRHINALYSAIRVLRLMRQEGSALELGGGLGITAMYAHKLGIHDYTILDLPITCLLAGHYLIHAVGENDVVLYGEQQVAGKIKILPYWECLNIPAKSKRLILNQDSLPEIADNLVEEYLNQFKRFGEKYFLSINHECFYPRTVNNFVRKIGGYEQIYRTRNWVREGYVEELYSIK